MPICDPWRRASSAQSSKARSGSAASRNSPPVRSEANCVFNLAAPSALSTPRNLCCPIAWAHSAKWKGVRINCGPFFNRFSASIECTSAT
jgi:hypothetical protein